MKSVIVSGIIIFASFALGHFGLARVTQSKELITWLLGSSFILLLPFNFQLFGLSSPKRKPGNEHMLMSKFTGYCFAAGLILFSLTMGYVFAR